MSRPSLQRHVVPPLSDARIDRQWSAVAGRLDPPLAGRWRRTAMILVALAAVGGVVAAAIWIRPLDESVTRETPLAGTSVESGTDHVTLRLDDGSAIVLDPGSRVEVRTAGPARLGLEVARGAATFDIAHRPERAVVVQAGQVEVRVVGTRFRVAREAVDRIDVSVERGAVDVRDRLGSRRLRAGERWGIGPEPASTAAPPSAARASPPVAPVTEAEVPAAASSEEPRAPERLGASARAQRLPATAEVAPEPVAAAGPTETAPAVPAPAGEPAAPAAPDARLLFDQANATRRAGRDREAAAQYERFLETFPADARTGLAALELGRLRMDAFGDTRGAIAPLERAGELGPTATVRESALARLVMAHDLLRDAAACRRALARYQSEFPDGAHAASIAGRCDGR